MDTSPTTLFNNYEQDFQQIIASIRDKVEGNSQSESVGELSFCRWMGFVCRLFWGVADVRRFVIVA